MIGTLLNRVQLLDAVYLIFDLLVVCRTLQDITRFQLSWYLLYFHSPLGFFHVTFPTLTHIDLVLLNPFSQSLEIAILVICTPIWVRVVVPLDPLHGYLPSPHQRHT